jgi:hypothetical protein
LGERAAQFPGKKVLFNQNIHKAFTSLGLENAVRYPCLDRDVHGILTVSSFALKYFQFAYPNKPSVNVLRQIDLRLFPFVSLARKKKVIAWFPKHSSIMHTLFHLLQSRAQQELNALTDFTWLTLVDKTPQQVSEILQEAFIFISSSTEEEPDTNFVAALLSGCIITGHFNAAVRKLQPPSCLFEHADAAGMAAYLEKVAAAFPDKIPGADSLQVISGQTAVRYSAEEQRRSVVSAWEQILGA